MKLDALIVINFVIGGKEMSFYIAESNENGLIVSGSITQLFPAPSLVRYPEKFITSSRTSRDGNPIVQSPFRDSRPRQWVWQRYSSDVINYDIMYNRLLNYHNKTRQTATPPLSPWVYVKEDSSGNLTYRQWNGSVWIEIATWVKVLVTQVTQNVADQPGHTVWNELVLEFTLEDPVFNLF